MDKGKWVEKAEKVIGEFSRVSPILLHCRIGTHGSTSIENVHPFIVNNSTVVAHNGVMPEWGNKTVGAESDTRAFVRNCLIPLPLNFIRNRGAMNLIGSSIGGGNKLAFLTRDKQLYHVNEGVDSFDKNTGIWFSNDYWSSTPYVSSVKKGYLGTRMAYNRGVTKRQVTTIKEGVPSFHWEIKCYACLCFFEPEFYWESLNMCFGCADQWLEELEGSAFNVEDFCIPNIDEMKVKMGSYGIFLEEGYEGAADSFISKGVSTDDGEEESVSLEEWMTVNQYAIT